MASAHDVAEQYASPCHTYPHTCIETGSAFDQEALNYRAKYEIVFSL